MQTYLIVVKQIKSTHSPEPETIKLLLSEITTAFIGQLLYIIKA